MPFCSVPSQPEHVISLDADLVGWDSRDLARTYLPTLLIERERLAGWLAADARERKRRERRGECRGGTYSVMRARSFKGKSSERRRRRCCLELLSPCSCRLQWKEVLVLKPGNS